MPEPPPYERPLPFGAFVTPRSLYLRRSGGGDDEDEIAALDLLVVGADGEPLDGAADRGRDAGLHLHRLDGRHHGAGLDGVALGDRRGDHTGEGRGNVAYLARVGLLDGLDVGGDRAVAHLDGAELAVERAHDGAHAVPVGVADAADAEQQALAGLDLGLVLRALDQAVEELDGAEDRQVAEAVAAVLELLGGAGEQQLVEGASR